MVRDTSTQVPWSRKSRDTSTQDNSDETQLHRWFVLNFVINSVVPKCRVAEVSGSLLESKYGSKNSELKNLTKDQIFIKTYAYS